MKIFKKFKSLVRNVRYHRIGKCNICGKITVFICSDMRNPKRNMKCLFCHSKSRNRFIARVVLEEFFAGPGSLKQIPRSGKDFSIYNTAANDAFYRVLYDYPQYFCSGFFKDIEVGSEIKERVYCQDLEDLSFEDEKFDVVISEHVFEHVRHDEKAFREVYRVLKPGGCHIFSFPFSFDKKTLVRVDTSGEKDVYILPPEYHGDPIDAVKGKIVAYRKYGVDIFDILERIGFETELRISTYVDLMRSGIADSYVFVSRKV